MPVSLIILAILLPPLAVFLDEGIGRNFWITFALTCLGFLPGIVFAFVTLLRKHRSAPRTG